MLTRSCTKGMKLSPTQKDPNPRVQLQDSKPAALPPTVSVSGSAEGRGGTEVEVVHARGERRRGWRGRRAKHRQKAYSSCH